MIYDFDVEDWQDPMKPVSGPAFNWSDIDMFVVHYTAAANVPDGDAGETQSQIKQSLRNIQSFYLKDRGYSIGYNAAVDQWGASYELRGERFKCAANSGDNDVHKHAHLYRWSKHNCNNHTFACLVFVDGDDSATPAAELKVANLVAQARKHNPAIRIVGHRDLGKTPCPGVGLYWQVTHNKFEPKGNVIVNTLEFDGRRVFDSRKGSKTGPGQVLTFTAPPGAKGIKLNVTVTEPSGAGFVTAFPAGAAVPITSSLNYSAGWTIANQVDVPVNAARQYSLFVLTPTHIIVDQVAVWS